MRWNNSSTGVKIISTTTTNIKKKLFGSGTLKLISDSNSIKINQLNGITSDIGITEVVQDRTYLDKIIIIEKSHNTGQLSAGTTASGMDVFISAGIAGHDATVIPVAKYFAVSTPIYIHHAGQDDTWNSMQIDIYFLFFKL